MMILVSLLFSAAFGGYTLFKLFIPENNDIYW